MSEFVRAIEPWADWGLATLWRASWQGGIALAVAWAIARYATFLSPRAVCWVWRLACVKLLVALVWVQPLAIPVWLPATAVIVPAPRLGGTNPVSTGTVSGAAAERAVPPRVDASAAQGGIWIVGLVLSLWLIGVAIRPVRFAVQWRAVRRLCRSALHPPAAVCDLFVREADRMLVKRLPRLRVSPETQVPLMAGIWRPMILLPAGADATFDVGEMRLMLAHELAHVKRHDLAWNWLPTIVDWLFFFHPLVWLMTRGWSESQEAACDELLIQRRVAAPVEYGRLLVKLATLRPRQPHPQLVVAGVLGMYRDLEKRILAMTRVKPLSFHRLAFTLAIFLLAAAPGIVPWRLVARGEQRTLVAAETPVAADAQALPGKIYADINLQTKTPAGETEKYSGVIAIDPNTGAWKKLGKLGFNLRVSPAGERIAYSEIKSFQAPRQKDPSSKSVIADPGTLPPVNLGTLSTVDVADLKTLTAINVADSGALPVWSPDGKELLYRVGTFREEEGSRGVTWLIDLATKQTRKLPIPAEDEVADWTGPGDWMVTVSDRHPPFGHGYQLYVMHPDGTDQRRITEGTGLNCYPRFRPDGKQIVYHHQGGGFDTLWLVDIDGGNRRKILSSNDKGHNAPDAAHWSPDGKWLAVALFDWQIEIPGIANPTKEMLRTGGPLDNNRIEIIAADGTHQRRLKIEGVSQIQWINSVDWH